MKLKSNQVLAVVYGDVFDWPLKVGEVKLWGITQESGRIKSEIPDDLVSQRGEYLFLKEREKLVKMRKEREEISKMKTIKAIKLIKPITMIPTVQGVFLTGSVPVGNAKEESDIDLMIICNSNTLWLTRLSVVGLLRLRGVYRGKEIKNKICTNIFLDENHLEVKEKNLYSAHEVLQARCVFDKEGVEKRWLRENRWTREYLPEACSYNVSRNKYSGKSKTDGEKSPSDVVRNTLYFIPEFAAFLIQYLYMKGKITNEKIGWGYAFFHPRDLSEEVGNKFEKKLRKLGLLV